MIDKSMVRYIAGLSRLNITDDQLTRCTSELEVILDYVRQLDALDVSGVAPTSHVLNVENVFRSDEVKPSLTNEEALSFAIEKHSGFYKVPRVIE